ncbi:hypothetical protein E4U32_002638 [Claviceps aff. humidiphila group G2b]|nr:hypothetical protein E4U32_002638 [Claviceps aff. humidiphila group G2b]
MEEHDDQAHRPPATFKGLLQLDAFTYHSSQTTSSSSSPRRNPVRAASTILPVLRSATPKKPSTSRPQKHPAHSTTITTTTSSPSSSSPTPKKRKTSRNRPPSGYAPPSQYAHLPLLPDALAPNLFILFIGLNPGISTALTGHAYAHPTNLFWKLLHTSGITPRRCHAHEDAHMPALYRLGLTNIVSRPTRNGSELSKAEMDNGVAILEEKAARWRPECVCVVGKSIWESIWRVRHGKGVRRHEFRYGWQDEGENMGVVEEGQEREPWGGARVFVAPSTSGLAATLAPKEKERLWGELGSWVKGRRAAEGKGGEDEEELMS